MIPYLCHICMLLNGLPLPYVQHHPPKRPEKRDVSAVLKQAFEGKQHAQQELGLKRIKAEQEVRLEIAKVEKEAKLEVARIHTGDYDSLMRAKMLYSMST
ncbi:hypothetical protein BGX38DRAFT_1176720 [Terfezia claveryi]|nr:hypothetical protein BGX38DRAFT_1176720 [Terfezia claveryi]